MDGEPCCAEIPHVPDVVTCALTNGMLVRQLVKVGALIVEVTGPAGLLLAVGTWLAEFVPRGCDGADWETLHVTVTEPTVSVAELLSEAEK
ncbi:hypothetical protein GCM10027294_29670 [Marinactinospora endophytica]